jgi:hydroxymethylglutaryl-CoA lyase
MNISLADTAGHAHPYQVQNIIDQIYKLNENIELTVHFHNTYGLGIANIFAAYECGVRTFETAFGGLGGCPFTKVAAGNVCTEDILNAFQRLNLNKNINIDKIIEVSKAASKELNHDLEGYIHKAGKLDYTVEV